MKENRVMLLILTIISIVVLGNSNTAYANTYNRLENVLIRLEDESVVESTMGEYGRAYSSKTKSDLYNFLIGKGKYIQVVGVSSGDKYMTIGDYGRKFSGLKSQGGLGILELTSRAIENSAHDDYLYSNSTGIAEYKVDIISLQMKDLDFRIDSNLVEANVPYEMLNKPIKTLNVAFDKPVKIIKLNGEELPLRFIDKIERSGYSLNEFYEEFNFNFGDSYKYSMIFDASSNTYKSTTIITVINELGYERNINVIITR